MRDKLGRFMKGHPVTMEMREKMSRAKIGRATWNRGIPLTDAHKKKLRDAKIGKPSPLKGCKLSEEHREKLSKARIGKYKEENHPGWRGDKAGYRAKHCWISKKYGKAHKCQNIFCESKIIKIFHWANLSGKHKRTKKDWLQLCQQCHIQLDKFLKTQRRTQCV